MAPAGSDEIEPALAIEASPEIRAMIGRMGRTEDIAFSPDNSRLAIADLLSNRIFFFSVRVDASAKPPRIAVTGASVLSSPGFDNPHGLTFLGTNHIIVCYRIGGLAVMAVPRTNGPSEFEARPLAVVTDKGLLSATKSPGSVAAYQTGPNRYRALVCNNSWHVVTSHSVTIGDSVVVENEGALIERDLRIPDGIAVSPDRAWIAVSSHAEGNAMLYRNDRSLRRTTQPAAILGGIVCPHGVRFSPDGKRIFVVDAASQYLHVFESVGGEWRSTDKPSRSVRLLDDHTFYSGRYDARDGGIKGVDIDKSGSVLATTHKGGAMEFFDLSPLLARRATIDADEWRDLVALRSISVKETKAKVLRQKWTPGYRISWGVPRKARSVAAELLRRSRAALTSPLDGLKLRNRTSRETLLDPAGPVLCLTTYGPRLPLAFHAIESIGLGRAKPSRMILWLADREMAAVPETLQRLTSRGLEIRLARDYGPHKKYYPYVAEEIAFDRPLVTADDDALYSTDWLELLVKAHGAAPGAIHGHRAHRIGLLHHRLIPYNMWEPCLSTAPSHLNLLAGVSGVIYPPPFLARLKEQGTGFERTCARTDDIWLKVNALRAGYKVAQVADEPVRYPDIEGSQRERLSKENLNGGNQRALMETLTAGDFAMLVAALAEESQA